MDWNRKIIKADPDDRYKNVRHVRRIGSQSWYAEELYRCRETKRVFIRQDLREGLVRWTTASKWSGGYEADTPLKDGLTIIVEDRCGSEIFREETYTTRWNGSGQSDKNHPFEWEVDHGDT